MKNSSCSFNKSGRVATLVSLVAVLVFLQSSTVHALFDVLKSDTIHLSHQSDEVDIYVPSASGDEIFPIVIILPEKGNDKGSYSNISIHIATRGYIVVVAHRLAPQGVTPSIELLTDALFKLSELDENSEEPLYRRVDFDQIGIVGHGLGGLLGVLTASSNGLDLCLQLGLCSKSTQFPSIPELKAVVAYGTDLINKRSGDYVPCDVLPDIAVNLFTGRADGISSVESARLSYENVLKAPKSRWVCEGMNHYSFVDDILSEELAIADPSKISKHEEPIKQLGKVISLILDSWLKSNHEGLIKLYVDKTLPSSTPKWIQLVDAAVQQFNDTTPMDNSALPPTTPTTTDSSSKKDNSKTDRE